MRRTTTANTIRLFTIAAGLLAVAACSAPSDLSKGESGCTEQNPCTTKKEAKVPQEHTPLEPAPAPAPAAPTPAPAADAGADSGGPATPPGPATHYCADLSACCNTLSNTIEKFACVGVAIANKETACRAEVAICSIGGIGGTPCSNLSKCCDQMQFEGYPNDAANCRGHNTGNASTCGTWLSQYKNAAWCS